MCYARYDEMELADTTPSYTRHLYLFYSILDNVRSRALSFPPLLVLIVPCMLSVSILYEASFLDRSHAAQR
jgi:hypothetical protein